MRVLNDVLSFRVTHISVVDKILADLLENDSRQGYRAVRMHSFGRCGSERKDAAHGFARKGKTLYSSYGMTETSSFIAAAPVIRGFDGGLELLPGYDARVVSPDADGIGQLHVAGPASSRVT